MIQKKFLLTYKIIRRMCTDHLPTAVSQGTILFTGKVLHTRVVIETNRLRCTVVISPANNCARRSLWITSESQPTLLVFLL